jgi:hypothetical protein
MKASAQCFIGGSTRLTFGTEYRVPRFKIRLGAHYKRHVSVARILLMLHLQGMRPQMITTGLGAILPTLFYGGLLAICIFLLGQLLPIVYMFVSEGL